MSRQRPQHNDKMTAPIWGGLALLTLLAAVLRLYALGRYSLWYDEAHTVYLSQYLDMPERLFDPHYNIEAPIMAVLIGLWSDAFHSVRDLSVLSPWNDFALRLLPAVFSIACVPLVFLAARRIFRDSAAALAAAFFCTVSPLQVYYAQELRVYSIYTALALLAAFFFVRVIEEERHRDYLALALLEVALMYAHFFSVWVIFCFNLVVLLLLPFQRSLFLRWTGYQLLVLVLIAPMLWLAWLMDREMTQMIAAFFPRPEWKTPLLTFKSFFAGYGFRPWAYYGLTAAAAGLIAIGFFVLRLKPRQLLVTVALFLVPLVGCTIIWRYYSYSFYEHRLFIFSGAVAYMLAGLGLAMLPKPLRWLGVAGILACTAPLLLDHYHQRNHIIDAHVQGIQHKVDLRGLAAYIDANAGPEDLVAHTGLFTTYPLMHYLPEMKHQHVCNTEQREIEYPKNTRNEKLFRNHGVLPLYYKKVIPEYDRVWVVCPDPNLRTFSTKDTPAQLAEQLRLIEEELDQRYLREFSGVGVYLFERPAEAAEPAETEEPAGAEELLEEEADDLVEAPAA